MNKELRDRFPTWNCRHVSQISQIYLSICMHSLSAEIQPKSILHPEGETNGSTECFCRTRFAYLRLSAKYIRQCMRYPRWLLLDNAGSNLFNLYDVPGNILLSLSLTATEDGSSTMTVESSSSSASFVSPFDSMLPMHSNNFVLRCYILQGRNCKLFEIRIILVLTWRLHSTCS